MLNIAGWRIQSSSELGKRPKEVAQTDEKKVHIKDGQGKLQN